MPEFIPLFLHVSCFLPCVIEINFKGPKSLRVSETTIFCLNLGPFGFIQNRDSLDLLLLVSAFNLTALNIKFYFHTTLLFSDSVSYLIFHLPMTDFFFIAEPSVLLIKPSLHPLFEGLFSLGTL
jgi:hypothetical protein